MKDWNVVITIHQDGYKRALRALREFGAVTGSPYHNVLVMTVADPLALLESMEKRTAEAPALLDAISRIAPALGNFDFESADDFRQKARERLLQWAPRLAGRSFHVRFHHRGTASDLPTPDVERFMNDALLEALRQAGTPGSISFSDPEVIIAIDTLDRRAGLGLWSREDLARHRLLRPD